MYSNAGSVDEFMEIIDEFMEIIDKADEEKKILMKDWQIQEVPKEPELNCWQLPPAPTGIAHTYMAAEGLEKAARRKTVSLK